MKKYILAICVVAVSCTALNAQTKNTQTLVPLTERVNVQADSARVNQIIDGCWVAVGSKKSHAIQRDFTRMFNGKPSYRFELKEDDNTLSGYAKGETKGRAEFSYCYATSDDFKGKPCRYL
jgi:heparin lyase